MRIRITDALDNSPWQNKAHTETKLEHANLHDFQIKFIQLRDLLERAWLSLVDHHPLQFHQLVTEFAYMVSVCTKSFYTCNFNASSLQ